jgi:hypothetical protein
MVNGALLGIQPLEKIVSLFSSCQQWEIAATTRSGGFNLSFSSTPGC